MSSVAVLLLADTESHGDLGRAANALETVKELKEHGDDVRLIFDGAATKWVVKLDGTEHKLSPLFAAVRIASRVPVPTAPVLSACRTASVAGASHSLMSTKDTPASGA